MALYDSYHYIDYYISTLFSSLTDLVTEEQVLISAKERSYPLYCNATLTKDLKHKPNVRWEHKLGGEWEKVVQGVKEDSKDGIRHKILEIDNKYNGPHEFKCIADLEGLTKPVFKLAQSYKNCKSCLYSTYMYVCMYTHEKSNIPYSVKEPIGN